MGEAMKGHLDKLGYLFYAVSPNRTSFQKVEDVPNYISEVVPYFTVLIVLEFIISWIKKKPKLRLSDGIGSLSQGMLQELTRALSKGLELSVYIYIYNHWRIANLPWDSPWTWFICFLGVDHGYYWFHRASHEINILWASHQVHHSSEDYNLTTALRQAIFNNYIVWVAHLPLALFVPPSIFLAHSQFNTLFQFWIHTELVNKLGPLEYVLNTASHHRVHHGRNRYCIDKNYAGVLIIWDRLYGTFEPEGEKVVYGLTHPINTFSPFEIQTCHFKHVFKTFLETPGIGNKLSVLLKGPGWSPGKPRLGEIEDIPDVHHPQEKYTAHIPLWCNVYLLIHFGLIVLGHIEVTERSMEMSQTLVLGAIAFQMFSLTCFGALFDNKTYAPLMELLRCASYLLLDYFYLPATRINHLSVGWILTYFIRATFLASTALWLFYCIQAIKVHFYKKKTD